MIAEDVLDESSSRCGRRPAAMFVEYERADCRSSASPIVAIVDFGALSVVVGDGDDERENFLVERVDCAHRLRRRDGGDRGVVQKRHTSRVLIDIASTTIVDFRAATIRRQDRHLLDDPTTTMTVLKLDLRLKHSR